MVVLNTTTTLKGTKVISEIDLRDYEQLPITKLYECKPRSYIKVPLFDDKVYFFDHIDGMYSFCKDMQGNTVHLTAWMEVIPLNPKATKPE